MDTSLDVTGDAETPSVSAPDAPATCEANPTVVRARQMDALLAAPGLAVGTGTGAAVTEANAELLRILGRDAADLAAGVAWADLVVAAPDRDAAAVDSLRRDGATVMARELLRPDGTRVPALIAISAWDWEPMRWVAVVVDLSTDERLRHMAGEEAAIVSSLLENAPVGFAFIDRELRFVRVNREIAAMNGHSVQAHEGVPVFDLLPDLRETAEPVLRGVLETGEPLRDVEIVGTTPADPGHVHTWVESFFPLRTANGPIVGVAAIARDETEVRALQEELARTSSTQQSALEQLQTSLLPARLPEVPGYRVAARYLPAAGVVGLGGDWYDLVETDGRLVAIVGDVVGHGIEAIGLMAQSSGATRAYASEGHDPGQVLDQLNTLLCRTGMEGFATAVLLRLDPATGEVAYSSAGHPHPLLCDAAGEVSVLDRAQGRLLGYAPGADYSCARVVLEPGATLVLFTDGLVERRGEAISEGTARVAAALAASPDDPVDEVADRVIRQCLSGRLADDACLLAIRRL